jgi:hypothetical protein
MKKVFLFILLFYSLNGFSQSFTLNELIKLTKSNDNNFDTYVLQRGFQFEDVENHDGFISKSYSLSINGAKRYYITKHIPKDNSFKWVSYQTPNSRDYLKMKEDLKRNGFLNTKSDTYNSSNLFEFVKDNCKITIMSGKEDSKEGYESRSIYGYNIKVYK